MTAPVNLTAGLKDVSSRGKQGEKFAIQIESDALMFDPSNKEMAAGVVEAMIGEVRRQLELGNRPDGKPLPALDPGTLEWREREAAQGARSGAAHERYEDATFRAKVERTYTRDYTATRSGKGYVPKAGKPRGIVSGMLYDSFFGRANRDGQGVTIYVAAKRGKARPGERLSALQSVFGEGQSLLSNALMASRSVKKAITDALKASLISKGTQRLIRTLADTASAVSELGEAAGEDIG